MLCALGGGRALRWRPAAAAAILLAGAAAWGAYGPLPAASREVVLALPKAPPGGHPPGHEAVHGTLRLTLGVRDVLVIRNEDDAEQPFGPVLLAPGQTYRLPFRRAGEFLFACSAAQQGHVKVLVEPAPGPGLARLRWRLARVFGS